MWLLALGCADSEWYASAFDWGYDRTRVVSVRVWPLAGPGGFPRLVDALILGPRPILQTRVEVCGLSEEQPAQLLGLSAVACFGTPELVEPVATQVPAWWVPAPLAYDCPASTGDSGDLGCRSVPLLRVVARSDVDEASAVISPILEPDPSFELAPGVADPQLELVAGELAPCGKVRVRFSTVADWPLVEAAHAPYQWYAEAGTWLGTGRTLDAGSDGGRRGAENWLRIPCGYRGPLRVSVVHDGPIPVWAERTWEIP
jgi:hypothetical protein